MTKYLDGKNTSHGHSVSGDHQMVDQMRNDQPWKTYIQGNMRCSYIHIYIYIIIINDGWSYESEGKQGGVYNKDWRGKEKEECCNDKIIQRKINKSSRSTTYWEL